jgi:glycosyltransferase involved in cell wall biosynthesis
VNDDAGLESRPPRGISVIIPVRNRAELIGHQLDALAKQTTTIPFEVVVVDNGSTDATGSVARAFEDRFARLEVVEAPEQRGAAHARNVGTTAAAGELLAFCDSDDVVHPEWLDALVAVWVPGSLVAGVIQPMWRLEATTPPVSTLRRRPRPPLRGFLPFADTANLAIGRQDLDGVGGFDESFRFSADVELSWRAQLAGVELIDATDAVVFKRGAPTGWIRFRQYHRWGRAASRLYAMYRPAGMPRRPLGAVARSWAVLGVHAVRGIRSSSHRDIAIRQAGWYTGYAAGSLRHRVVYL